MASPAARFQRSGTRFWKAGRHQGGAVLVGIAEHAARVVCGGKAHAAADANCPFQKSRSGLQKPNLMTLLRLLACVSILAVPAHAAPGDVDPLNADGNLDPASSPMRTASSLAWRCRRTARLSSGAGSPAWAGLGALFARLFNDPVTQMLSAPGNTHVTWTRGGSASGRSRGWLRTRSVIMKDDWHSRQPP